MAADYCFANRVLPSCRLFANQLPVLCLMLVMMASPALAQISPEQRAALIALYDSTNGPDWARNDGWQGEPGSECDWFGVICQDGQVLALDLRSNELSGELPEELADLVSLRFLALRNNNISGGLPDWLGQMASLEALDLGHNPLGGRLPAALLESTTLINLWLEGSGLVGSISNVQPELTQLQGLFLSDNDISGKLSVSFANLHQLRYVWLDGNRIEGDFPAWLGGLTELRELSLRDNDLGTMSSSRSLPTSLGTLPHLHYLDASYSSIGMNFSDWLNEAMALADNAAFPALKHLDLGSNMLTGAIPSQLAMLPELAVLRLQDTLLSGPLPEQGLLPTRIQDDSGSPPIEIDLQHNWSLTGSLPPEVTHAMFKGRALVLFSSTNLEFGSCMGWRQVSSVNSNPVFRPGDEVQVRIYTHPMAIGGSGRIFDTVPESWDVVPRPSCYCVEGDPQTVRSALTPPARRLYFEYVLESPEDVHDVIAGSFSGQVVPADSSVPPGLICGESRGWVDSIFLDHFLTSFR